MERIKNVQLSGAAGRPFLLDIYLQRDQQPKPIVLFAHGFKGFKDWGHWHLIAEQFAQAGFLFIKFNFSHNGTTLAAPTDFADLEAFGHNNYSKELADVSALMTWLHRGSNELPSGEFDLRYLFLIGHSRGGPIAMLHALEDPRIAAVAGWASVSSLAYAWNGQEMIEHWEKQGVYQVINGRTGQEMPIYYQMYQDFLARREFFNLKRRLPQMEQPLLLVHGTEDPAVPEAAAHELKRWKEDARLHLIEGADHVFGGKHPYESSRLPAHSKELAEVTIDFFRSST